MTTKDTESAKRSAQLPSAMQLEDLRSMASFVSPLELRLPEDLDIQEWAGIGRRLCKAEQVVKWWLGDWAAFGLRKYNEERRKDHSGTAITLKDFAAANGYHYQTLANLAWVSRSVDVSRRRESLEWSKHQEVAALAPKEQARWLGLAEREALPVARLRQQIRMSQGEINALEADGPVIKLGLKSCGDLKCWMREHPYPSEFWNSDRRQIWREELRPIVEFYNAL